MEKNLLKKKLFLKILFWELKIFKLNYELLYFLGL